MIKRLIDKDELLNKYRPANNENQAEYLLYCMLENAVRTMPVIEAQVNENGSFESETKEVDILNPTHDELNEIARYIRKKHKSIDRRKPAREGGGIKQDKSGRWTPRIVINKKTYYLGTYATREEAVAAREEAERLMWRNIDDKKDGGEKCEH